MKIYSDTKYFIKTFSKCSYLCFYWIQFEYFKSNLLIKCVQYIRLCNAIKYLKLSFYQDWKIQMGVEKSKRCNLKKWQYWKMYFLLQSTSPRKWCWIIQMLRYSKCVSYREFGSYANNASWNKIQVPFVKVQI